MSTAVTRSLSGRLTFDRYTPASVPILARLDYRPTDPLAVRLSIPAAVPIGGGLVEWFFARDLLDQGLRDPSGAGDVRIRPSEPDRTMFEFATQQGAALIDLPSDGLREFLHSTYAAVPVGDEGAHLDLDALVAELLNDV